MALVRLFVRSKRTTLITGQVSVESVGAAHTTTEYAEGSTHTSLPPEDARALSLLRKSGVKFEKIDLSGSLKAKFVARFRGAAKTPTLLVQGSGVRRYYGVAAISQYINETNLNRSQTDS